MRKLGRAILLGPFVLVAIAWSCAALYFDAPGGPSLPLALSSIFLMSSAGLLLLVRPFPRALGAQGLLTLLVAIWWMSLEPSNDRDWLPDVDRPAWAEIEGDRLTFHNMRDFEYRTEHDYTERWATRSYDLSKLKGVDLFLSYWSSPWLAHTIVSWEFEDGQHLSISIETRKEKGEEYSAVRGFFRQFELYYVVSDERDLIRLRTNYRGEDVYLYRFHTPVEMVREVLLDYVREINHLRDNPRWYNAGTHNCTTAIRHHIQNVAPVDPWNWRILLSGKLDELAYMRGTVDTSMPFEELRKRSAISERAQRVGDGLDYSARIREGLPGAHSSPP